MPDLNQEALAVWDALKPMIDQEITNKTQGMVQRRKAKVTTAPSLVTNTIGVTEAFGRSEMFLPFVSNIISANVGDFVWVEWMYGATNAFVSSFASVDKKNKTVAGDLTVNGNTTLNGVLDVANRRCYATLSSSGWYRVFNVTGGLGRAGSSFTITLHIGRSFTNTTNELHTVTLFANYDNREFSSEVSKSNALGITKVRYTTDGSNNGHIDIYYDLTAENIVYVNFNVHCRPENAYLIRYNAVTPTAVADSPSGETVVTEYTFANNTTINETVPKNSSFGASTFTCYARRRNGIGVVYLNVAVPATSSWSETTMCTMTTFKPSINMAFTVNGQGGSTFLVQFYTSGNITIWAPSATAAQFLRGSFVLFVD